MLKKLDIYKPYVQGFKNEKLVCFFEQFAGYWDYQDKEIESKRKEIKKKYNCLVYAITHEFIDEDETYSFLLVSNYPEEWAFTLQDAGANQHYATAYVCNKSCAWCSEFGDVVIQNAFGGIRRIA